MNDLTILTIYGASGDLSKLKLMPAIYVLAKEEKLPEGFFLFGFARSSLTSEEFRQQFRESVQKKYENSVDEVVLEKLLEKVHYYAGQYDDQSVFENFRNHIQEIIQADLSSQTQINYFSVPPNVFEKIVENIALTRKADDEDIRLVIEKPFGLDQESAKNLYHLITRYFDESCVYLLDHYLGKDTIASILELRRSNRILGHILSGGSISNIQINALEDFGVEERLGYFDQVGIIRDFVQSHILQILALLTMSIPTSDSTHQLRQEKHTILSALEFVPDKDNVVIGQYESYKNSGEQVASSQIDTFVALELQINRQDWSGIPVYIRAGKKMDKTLTNIVIEFKKYDFQNEEDEPNRLIVELKPNEKLEIQLMNNVQTNNEGMSLWGSFQCDDGVCASEHAQLILEVINGGKINFLGFEEVLESWRVVDSVLQYLENNGIEPSIYSDNSMGPEGIGNLVKGSGQSWY